MLRFEADATLLTSKHNIPGGGGISVMVSSPPRGSVSMFDKLGGPIEMSSNNPGSPSRSVSKHSVIGIAS